VAAVVAAAVAALSGGGGGDGAAATANGDLVDAKLGPVPFNRVKGVGKTVLSMKGDVATVTVTANGLLQGGAHLMHIHAGKLGRCPPGSVARKHNGQLSIFTHDGAPFYGPVQTALTTKGDSSPKSLLVFGRFPKTAKIDYKRKIRLSPVAAAQVRANNAVVVIHGIDYNHNNRYDRSLEGSDLDRSISAESTAPGLCGPLVAEQPERGKGKASAQAGGATTVYTATLQAEAPHGPGAFECFLPPTPGARL
jgi:hypothetical protein